MKNKSSVIQMFLGHRGHCDTVKRSGEYFKLMEKVVEYDKELRAKLAIIPDLFELFNKLCDSIDEAHSEEIDCYYEEGFNFGLLIGFEAAKS